MFAVLKKLPPWGWVILGFLSLNLATYDWYPSVWNDEAFYSDPAANLYFGNGFTSTASMQPRGEYWVGNSPLYPFLLFAWFKLAGFGIFQDRMLGYLLWSAGVALLCLMVQRARLIRGPAALAVLAGLLFSGYAVVFNYRSGRYDPLILVEVAACSLAFTIPHPGWRRTAIFFSAALFLPTALTLGPFAAGFSGLFFLVMGRKFFTELACVALGLATGLGALYTYVCRLGLWSAYRRITVLGSQSRYAPGQTTPVWQRKLADFPHKLIQDPASLILLLCLLGIFFGCRKKMDAAGRRLVFLGVATFFVMPVMEQATYAYEIFHCWQIYLPLAICLVALLDRPAGLFPARTQNRGLVVLALIIFTLGLGLRLGLESTDRAGRDYSQVEQFVERTIRPGDVVMADNQAFYPLHQLNVTAYYCYYLFTIKPPEAGTINCLLINPGWLGPIRDKLGGDWVATGESYTQENKFTIAWLNRIFPHYYQNQSNQKYNLIMYRRVPVPPQHP
jgi:hypothetical protein